MVKFGFGDKISNVYPELCRRCLNDIYNARIEPKQCLYDTYMCNCSRCGAYSHIVRKVNFSGFFHLMLHKRMLKRKMFE